MIKIPDNTKRYSIPNDSDYSGNIHYTKNITFTGGYIKLSPRSVNIMDTTLDADFDIPTSFGRQQAGEFYTVTVDQAFIAQMDESACSTLQDAGASVPSFGFDSTGTWWQNLWFATTETKLYSKDPSSGDWTDHSISLTTGKVHPLEVFTTSANHTLCIGNGNEVMQIDTSYSTSGIAQLTIPANFEVVDLAYNNGLLGISTRLSDSSSGQDGEAFFFTWDGLNTSANGAWGVGSDSIVSLVPYKSTFLLTTRKGNVLLFNGGGFQEVFSLPHYYERLNWGDSVNRVAIGDVVKPDGNVVYFNYNGAMENYGIKGQVALENQPGGIGCYDEKIGFYHYGSPSVSKASYISVADSNVDTTADILTVSATGLHATLPVTGNPIKYIHDATVQIGGLKTGTVYYIITHSSTTFSIAATYQDALDGNKVDLTSAGSSFSHFLALNVVDYGAVQMGRTGGIGLAEKNTHALDTMIFGGELTKPDNDSTTAYLCAFVSGFENIGYFVTPKIQAQKKKDAIEELYIKFKPLKTGEQIIVKEKVKDVLGLPVLTPSNSVNGIWTSTTTVTTTADISEAYAYVQGGGICELEITAGAGGGNIQEISSIEYSAGTYTITIPDAVFGVSASDICHFKIDNWETIQTVTSDNVDGIVSFNGGQPSKWVKYKVILIGDGVTIEETNIVNSSFE